MNDDYDNHILQKYRLAIALAIIRNTPENSTPKTYLELLRNNIAPEMEPFDPDMTVCDDDFNYEDDKDKSMNALNENNETQVFDSQTNDSVTILKDFDFNDMIQNINNDNCKDVPEDNSVSDALRILRGHNNEEIIQVSCDNGFTDSQSTYFECSQTLLHQPSTPLNKSKEPITGVIREPIFTPMACQLESFNEINNKINFTQNMNYTEITTSCATQNDDLLQEYTDNFTHISQSQIDNVTEPRHFIEKERTKIESRLINEFQESLNSVVRKSVLNRNVFENNKIWKKGDTDTVVIKKSKPKNNYKKQKYATQEPNNIDDRQAKRHKSVDNLNLSRNTHLGETNSQFNINLDTHLKTNTNRIFENRNKNENNKNLTPNHEIIDKVIVNNLKHVDKSNKHYIQDNNKIDSIQTIRPKNVYNKIKSKAENFNEIKNTFKITSSNNSEINSSKTQSETNDIYSNLFQSDDTVCGSLYNFNTNIDCFNKATKILDMDKIPLNVGSQISTESNDGPKLAYNSQTFSQFSLEFESQASEIHAEDTKKQNAIAEDNESEEVIEELFDKLTDSQSEVVPFKVLEELNRVKLFLNKNRTSSADCVLSSGYKSDSQSRSSFKNALQSSNTGLNQSAHCLLSYVTTCSLGVNTEDIVNEISRSLGRLIDRLHEDEKYPSFLEEHLHTVDALLNKIYEEESADKLLEKDENIHRLFLLNKSSHIIKYSTEKIITILESVLVKLTEDLEISDTIQTENLCYIFHILETFIKKLLAFKDFSSQHSTQSSQEDDVILKRSSLTAIWRKKWNFDGDFVKISGTKQCVLERCSETLNKLIVQAMDGYTLISYSALQCFNLLQN